MIRLFLMLKMYEGVVRCDEVRLNPGLCSQSGSLEHEVLHVMNDIS
jgi:hypothetical protein